MRLLVDANIAQRAARLLATAGHEVTHVRDLAMARASDEEIFAKAVELGAVIVSEDTDFGALLARRRVRVPSLILLRSADPLRPDQQASVIAAALPVAEVELRRGAILVLGRGRARLRPLPIAGSE